MTQMPGIQRLMGPFEWGVLVFLSIVWGGSFFFVEVALSSLPTITIVATRVAIGAICLHLASLIMGWKLPRNFKGWATLAGMSLLLNVIPFTLIVWGQTILAGGIAAILNATTPLFGVVTAHFLTRDEPMTAAGISGVLIGLLGVTVLIGIEEIMSFGGEILPYLAILAAAQSYALAAVFGRRLVRMGISPMASARGQLTISALLLLPVAAWFEQPWTLQISLPSIYAMIALGTLSTALAFVLYFRILATSGATNILLVTLLVPVSAILLGVTILGEILLPRHLAGLFIIGSALVIIDGRAAKRFKGLIFHQ